MARRVDTSAYTTFADINSRLEDIVTQVRRKDLPLESTLDLYDEAIALGSKAVDFVDTAEATPVEIAAATQGAPDATSQPEAGNESQS